MTKINISPLLQALRHCLFVLVVIIGGTANATADSLKPITIGYTLKLVSDKLGSATLGKLQTTLQKTDTGYSVSSVTKAQGMAAILLGSNWQQSCEFSVDQGRAVPTAYSGGRKNSDDYTASFDWQQRKVSFADGESLDMPQGYLVDDCNMPFAAALLKSEGLSEQTLYILDGKKKRIRGFRFKSTKQETIETALGPIDTIKIVLEREFKPDRTLSLWLSPTNDYVPLKMEEKRRSRTTTILVNSIDS